MNNSAETSNERMSAVSRSGIGAAASLLGLTFYFPLWKITIDAPQYPEGLSLSIWSSKFTGDIKTINILNHYIGMAPIEMGQFPELEYFPKIFGGLILAGVTAAWVGRRGLAWLWSLALLGFLSWSMYDFYQWEVRYGHDLNPNAAIQMEGMAYQPPLLGTKVLLNIEAGSYPDLAGYALLLASLLTFGAVMYDLVRAGRVENS